MAEVDEWHVLVIQGDKEEKYLVKWKDRSYLHTTWESQETLLGHGGKQVTTSNDQERCNEK